MKNRLVLILIGTIFVLAGTETVLGCWCRHVTDCEATNRAEAAFVGTVIEIKTVESKKAYYGSPKTIRFQVDEPFFGVQTRQITIQTGSEEGSDCSYFPFQVGERYIVFAAKVEDNILYAGLCGGTKVFPKAKKTLEYLRSLPDSTNNGRIYGSVHGVRFNNGAGLFEGTYLNGIRLSLEGNGLNETIFTGGKYRDLEFGDFSIDNLKAGKYRLQVFLPSYYGFKYDDGFVREINLNGRGCSHQYFSADVENSIEGTVTDQNGNPLKEVEVSLVPATKREDDTADDTYSVSTDSQGRFSINYVFPRDYYLGINIIEPDDDEETCGKDEECEEEGSQSMAGLYYPNTSDKAKAKCISFGLGQKYNGYDLVLEKSANK